MEQSNRNIALVKRSVARLALVQYLYSCYLMENHVDSLEALKFLSLYQFKDLKLEESVKPCPKHYKKLLEAVQMFQTNAEEKLDSVLKIRSFEANDPLIRAILLVAVCEKMADEKLPKNVMINEYTNITASFYSKDHAGFINAALNEFANNS